MAKLTGWYGRLQFPVRIGVYLSTVDQTVDWYRYWDGESWHYGGHTPEHAFRVRGRTWLTGLHWRGLASPPKGAK